MFWYNLSPSDKMWSIFTAVQLSGCSKEAITHAIKLFGRHWHPTESEWNRLRLPWWVDAVQYAMCWFAVCLCDCSLMCCAAIRNDKDIAYYYYFIFTLKMVLKNMLQQHMYYIIKWHVSFFFIKTQIFIISYISVNVFLCYISPCFCSVWSSKWFPVKNWHAHQWQVNLFLIGARLFICLWTSDCQE